MKRSSPPFGPQAAALEADPVTAASARFTMASNLNGETANSTWRFVQFVHELSQPLADCVS